MTSRYRTSELHKYLRIVITRTGRRLCDKNMKISEKYCKTPLFSRALYFVKVSFQFIYEFLFSRGQFLDVRKFPKEVYP